ncbi:FecR family protein [Leptothoe sp. PORK10 BA2]|uniref:FecR family protein n=1 Tax=Leptothoe sp. PORK10 BA2 TaxID=3110254 RepID=UPI002B1F9A67|nr:FecR domain-containing protein [Leptothoe sp. PORK10 BA2]MEA5466182.1 FecR domain-containing protein [Leptothoe sp. PORK10 BA2]
MLSSLLAVTTFGLSLASTFEAESAVRRALHVRRTSGTVTTVNGQQRRTQVGDQLTASGHGLITGHRSSANLAIDGGSGSVSVAQNTQMTIQQLSVSSRGGHVTVLDVPRGQARVQVPTFTNPSSRLELHTPSGVAAVRGTVFGVSVSENGKTGIATLEGKVEASAQSVKVPVAPGMVSIIHPGEAPTPARPLDRTLEIQWNLFEWRGNRLYVEGKIDSANSLLVAENEISVDRHGYFKSDFPLSKSTHRVIATVQNPMGETRDHRLFRWIVHDFDL